MVYLYMLIPMSYIFATYVQAVKFPEEVIIERNKDIICALLDV